MVKDSHRNKELGMGGERERERERERESAETSASFKSVVDSEFSTTQFYDLVLDWVVTNPVLGSRQKL